MAAYNYIRLDRLSWLEAEWNFIEVGLGRLMEAGSGKVVYYCTNLVLNSRVILRFTVNVYV
jgi:hypothetical protein